MEKHAHKVLAVGSSFILKNLRFLSKFHSDCMGEKIWGEDWTDNLDGDDPRTNSPAMWKHLIDLGCKFYVILDGVDIETEVSNENFKGIGVLLPMNSQYIESMEWTKQLLSNGVQVQAGDWSMDLFLVNPKYRRNGVLRSLGTDMNEYLNTLTHKQNSTLWIQTRVRTVEDLALDLGFRPSLTVVIKNTSREILCKNLS